MNRPKRGADVELSVPIESGPMLFRLMLSSAATLVMGLAGIAFAITARLLFPYAPSTHGGDLLIACCVFTQEGSEDSSQKHIMRYVSKLVICRCAAAVSVLFGSEAKATRQAHRAAILCIIVQIAASFSVLLVTTEASFDFCFTKKPCWVGVNVTNDIKCDVQLRDACDDNLSPPHSRVQTLILVYQVTQVPQVSVFENKRGRRVGELHWPDEL